jgi:hypothetical protein
MGINDCCEVSMHQINDDRIADGFVQTNERNPIGKDMVFYTCVVCGVRWCHTQETFEPFKSTWAEVV